MVIAAALGVGVTPGELFDNSLRHCRFYRAAASFDAVLQNKRLIRQIGESCTGPCAPDPSAARPIFCTGGTLPHSLLQQQQQRWPQQQQQLHQQQQLDVTASAAAAAAAGGWADDSSSESRAQAAALPPQRRRIPSWLAAIRAMFFYVTTFLFAIPGFTLMLAIAPLVLWLDKYRRDGFAGSLCCCCCRRCSWDCCTVVMTGC